MADRNKRNQKGKVTTKTMHRHRKRACYFCVEKVQTIPFQETGVYKRFISERGKIVKKRVSSVCAKHQRQLARAVKKARVIGLVPYFID